MAQLHGKIKVKSQEVIVSMEFFRAGRSFHIFARAKAVGHKVAELCFQIRSVLLPHIDLKVRRAELQHHLPADSAGREVIRRHTVLAAHDGDGRKVPL